MEGMLKEINQSRIRTKNTTELRVCNKSIIKIRMHNKIKICSQLRNSILNKWYPTIAKHLGNVLVIFLKDVMHQIHYIN